MTIEYLTAILVFVTAIYAYLTHRMSVSSDAAVSEMRAQTEALNRPYIVAKPYIRPHTSILYLKIENTGKTAANDLKLILDKDFFQFGEGNNIKRNIRTMSAFALPIDSFPPGAELIFALAQGWVVFGADSNPNVTPTKFTINAAYNYAGKSVQETNIIDLDPYHSSENANDPVVEELERIRKVIEKNGQA